MKKSLILFTISIFAIPFILSSCKYEEGPALSLKSKTNRISNTWEIEKAEEDGEDVTENYDQYELQLFSDGDARLVAIYTFGDFTFEGESDGTWEFVDDKESVKLDMEDDDLDKTYQILRLADDELWVREKGGDVEIHLVPK